MRVTHTRIWKQRGEILRQPQQPAAELTRPLRLTARFDLSSCYQSRPSNSNTISAISAVIAAVSGRRAGGEVVQTSQSLWERQEQSEPLPIPFPFSPYLPEGRRGNHLTGQGQMMDSIPVGPNEVLRTCSVLTHSGHEWAWKAARFHTLTTERLSSKIHGPRQVIHAWSGPM